MEPSERVASAAAVATAMEAPATCDGGTMEDAMGAIVVSQDALVVKNDLVELVEMANAETASVASDGTVDLEQMQEVSDEGMEGEEAEETAATEPEVAASKTTMEDKEDKEDETLTGGSTDPTTLDANTTDTNTDTNNSTTTNASNTNNTNNNTNSSDSSSSDIDSSSSSTSSSDSDVEDVTDQYQQTLVDPHAPRATTMSESGDDDVDAEQWFDEPTPETNGVEVVGVGAQPQDVMGVAEEEEEDVFLMPFQPAVERGSATKRPRPEDDPGSVVIDENAGEETTSSEPEPVSDDEFGHHRKATTQRKKVKSTTKVPTKSLVISPPVVYTSVPASYAIFNNVSKDDSNFPFLKGDYEIRGTHRAHFTGLWGFTDADFKIGMVSKFEYTSSYLHGRRDHDRRPVSGVYGGYFNLRQFSGKITKIKEDHIQLHFVQLQRDPIVTNQEEKKEEEDEHEEEDNGVEAQYEVFGEGQNRYGAFLVRGYFSATTGRMTVRRRYLE